MKDLKGKKVLKKMKTDKQLISFGKGIIQE